MSNTNTTIVSRDPAELRPHHLHKHLPEPVKDSPAWHSFVDALHLGGPLNCPPVVVNPEGRIMDGVRRWHAARQMQWERIPTVTRPDQDAALLMVESLMGQRDMTRGAKVYLALGILTEYADADEDRRCARMAAGDKNPPKSLGKRLSSNLTEESCRTLSERWGVSHETINLARYVRNLLHDEKCAHLAELHRDERVKCPPLASLQGLQAELRAEFEGELLAGEKNLWNVRSGIAGKLTTEDRPKIPHQLELNFNRTMRSLASQITRAEDPLPMIQDWLKSRQDEPEDIERMASFGAALAREAKAILRHQPTA